MGVDSVVVAETQGALIESGNKLPVGLLDFKDLIHAQTLRLGLRHVSTRQDAQREMTEGVIYGDALAAGSVVTLAQQSLGRSDILISGQITNPQDQGAIAAAYSGALKQFFAQSVGMDMNRIDYRGKTTQDVLERLVNAGPSFLMIAPLAGADFGYDERSYFSLGKCGSGAIPHSLIRSIFGLYESDLTTLYDAAQELRVNATFDETAFGLVRRGISDILVGRYAGALRTLPNSFANSAAR